MVSSDETRECVSERFKIRVNPLLIGSSDLNCIRNPFSLSEHLEKEFFTYWQPIIAISIRIWEFKSVRNRLIWMRTGLYTSRFLFLSWISCRLCQRIRPKVDGPIGSPMDRPVLVVWTVRFNLHGPYTSTHDGSLWIWPEPYLDFQKFRSVTVTLSLSDDYNLNKSW